MVIVVAEFSLGDDTTFHLKLTGERTMYTFFFFFFSYYVYPRIYLPIPDEDPVTLVW